MMMVGSSPRVCLLLGGFLFRGIQTHPTDSHERRWLVLSLRHTSGTVDKVPALRASKRRAGKRALSSCHPAAITLIHGIRGRSRRPYGLLQAGRRKSLRGGSSTQPTNPAARYEPAPARKTNTGAQTWVIHRVKNSSASVRARSSGEKSWEPLWKKSPDVIERHDDHDDAAQHIDRLHAGRRSGAVYSRRMTDGLGNGGHVATL